MWSDKWLGRRYCKETFDCAELVLQVARELHGVEVVLPSVRSWRTTNPASLLFAVNATPTDSPVDGDVVLMKYIGVKRAHGGHVGSFVQMDGADWVLHNLEGLGVILHPIAQLGCRMLDFEGFYACRT